MPVEVFERDNLITATKPLITVDLLQLESGVVVRGEVLKKGTTGLVKLSDAADVPYCVSLQNIDATGGAKEIVYSYDCSVMASELTFGAGTIDDFRDDFVASTSILVEE
jgi:hypothetical protein